MNHKQRRKVFLLSYSGPVTSEDYEAQEKKRDAILSKLPEGFGPEHRDWRIPSLREKYMMAHGHTFPMPKLFSNRR